MASNFSSMDSSKLLSSIPNNLCYSHSTLNPSKLRHNNRGNKAGDNPAASTLLVNNNPNNPITRWNPHSFRQSHNKGRCASLLRRQVTR